MRGPKQAEAHWSSTRPTSSHKRRNDPLHLTLQVEDVIYLLYDTVFCKLIFFFKASKSPSLCITVGIRGSALRW